MGGDASQTDSKQWRAVEKVPRECESRETKVEMETERRVAFARQSNETRVREEATFLQSKQA